MSVELFARHSSERTARASPLDMVRDVDGVRPEHPHGVANKIVDCSDFGRNASVSTEKYREFWRMSMSGRLDSAISRKF